MPYKSSIGYALSILQLIHEIGTFTSRSDFLWNL